MPLQTLSRRVDSKTFVDNSEITVDIPRVQDINSIEVHVRGDLVIGTAAATALQPESPANLITRFDFVANGKDVLDQISGAMASRGNYSRKFQNLNIAPGLTVATHPVDAVYILDRDMIDGVRPKDSSFQAYLTNLLQLRIVTGDADGGESSVLVNPDATTTLAFTGVIDVYIDSSDDSDRGEAKFVKKITRQQQTYTGANSAAEFRLPIGNHIRSIGIRTLDDSVPVNTLLGNMEFAIDGVDVRFSRTYEATRVKNAKDKGLSLSAIPTGHAVIDLAPSGKMSNIADLTNASECKVTLGVNAPSGTGIVELTIEEYIFPQKSNG